jgi:hypothetical protein
MYFHVSLRGSNGKIPTALTEGRRSKKYGRFDVERLSGRNA